MTNESSTDAMGSIEGMLARSRALHGAIFGELEFAVTTHGQREQAVLTLCSIALEHGCAVTSLMANGYISSAVGLVRAQFESVARGMWLLYAASESVLPKITAPLTVANERAAKSLPSMSEMIEQMRGCVGVAMPRRAFQMLEHFKEASWVALNSFVHAGIHPLRRHADGYPTQLVLDVLRNSNGLSTMTAMTLAVLTGDHEVCRRIASLQVTFEDCLPPLQPPRVD